MSEEARNAIATAATTVDGVTVMPYYRQSAKPGEGMVRLERIDFPNRFGGVATWQVFISLPQDLAAAEKWIEAKVNELVTALSNELEIASVIPVSVQLPDGGSMPCLVIEGRREED